MIQSLAASSAVSLAGASTGWSNSFAEKLRDDMLKHWRSTAEYSLEVLEAMPAEHFDYRPTDEQMTFAEQLTHFASSNAAYFSGFGKEANPPRPERPQELTKDNVRNFSKASFAYVEALLKDLTEEDFLRRDVDFRSRSGNHTAQDIFFRAYMHTAHHRGTVVTYLRLKGIKPPRWRFPPNGDA
jgi:uncharacterized damage-inducible protein DinB